MVDPAPLTRKAEQGLRCVASLRAEEAGMPARMPFSELVSRVAFLSSWSNHFPSNPEYKYFASYVGDP